MTTTEYTLIPTERDWLGAGGDWPADAMACAQSLVDGANGDRDQLAALSLLFRDPELTIFRMDVIDGYVNGVHGATVDWRELHRDADGYVIHDLSEQSRAVVMLACSMAHEKCAVRLGDLLGDLGEQTRHAFAEAMASEFGES